MVALGTFYAQEIGQIYNITFSDERTIKAIVGDVKANCDTDIKNQYCIWDNSIVEFIIDESVMDKAILESGDVSPLVGEGAVMKIWEAKQ